MSDSTQELKQKQIEEAIARLQYLTQLGLHKDVLIDFKKKEYCNYYSERTQLGGILYWVSNDTAKFANGVRFSDVISKFEEKNNAVVYHATHEQTEFGELLDLFYVSQYTEEWEFDREELKEGRTLAYVSVEGGDIYSEIGLICYKIVGGGIIRTS